MTYPIKTELETNPNNDTEKSFILKELSYYRSQLPYEVSELKNKDWRMASLARTNLASYRDAITKLEQRYQVLQNKEEEHEQKSKL